MFADLLLRKVGFGRIENACILWEVNQLLTGLFI